MLKGRCLLGLSFFVAMVVNAGEMGEVQSSYSETHPWSIVGSLGYTYFDHVSQGGTAIGRLAVAKDIYSLGQSGMTLNMSRLSGANFGLEFGVQNGNRMAVSATEAQLTALGGLPIWTTSKPMLDLLGTLQVSPMENMAGFLLLKGGVAWREWVSERETINNLAQAAGEVQVGMGVPIADAATLSILYQGIFGSNPNFTVDSTAATGHLYNIPVQNGVLLSMSITL